MFAGRRPKMAEPGWVARGSVDINKFNPPERLRLVGDQFHVGFEHLAGLIRTWETAELLPKRSCLPAITPKSQQEKKKKSGTSQPKRESISRRFFFRR